MNINDRYFIPEDLKDESLRSVSVKVKEVLNDNVILEDILQKYIVAYNKTLKQRSSAKSLKVMKQNHNPFFSTNTISGGEKSPCSRFNVKMNSDFSRNINHQHRTPLKTNRINSNTERKRLLFDDPESECMKTAQEFTEDSNAGQIQIDISSPFSIYDDTKLHDGQEEISYLNGIPEYAAPAFFHHQAARNLSIKSPYRDQTINFLVNEKRNPWYLECRPSIFSLGILPKAFDSPDKYIQERFNLEGKPETITKLAISDSDNTDESTKTPDKYQKMTTSPEEKNGPFANHDVKGRTSARCLPISSSKKEVAVFDKHNTNEQKPFCPGVNEIVSSLPVDQQKPSCTSYSTPEKPQTISVDANKEERRTKKQIAVKRFTVKIALNEKENLSDLKDAKTSHNLQIKKRKLVDNSEKALMVTSQATVYHESMVPFKISKLKNAIMTNDETAAISPDFSDINDNDSICSAGESPTCAKTHLNSAVDSNDSSNRPGDSLIVDQDVIQTAGKSSMSAVSTTNNCKIMSVTPVKKSEGPPYEASIRQGCRSHFLPEANKKKIEIEVGSAIRNSKNDKIKIGVHETKDVESLTNLMKNLSPSVKRSFGANLKETKTNGSVGDVATLEEKLSLQDTLSKLATPPKECLNSNKPSLKTNDMYAIQVVKFLGILKERRTRFSKYLHLFVDDRDDLKFICAYIEILNCVVKEIQTDNNNEVLVKAINSFVNKSYKFLNKAHLWEFDIEKDFDVWEDCIQKNNQMEQDIKRLCGEKSDMDSKGFNEIEESFRIVNKKADDMILLREIRRPTIIQFVYELQGLIRLFIEIMLQVGLLKHSSTVSSYQYACQ